MKTYLKILAVLILMISCQSNEKEDESLGSVVEKVEISQTKNMDSSRDLQTKATLIKEQFTSFFPEQIGAYKLINVSVLMSSALASAVYIKGNDYNNSMTYSLEDGKRKGSAILRNFEDSYNLKGNGPEETEYVYTERNGYKTIAFIQPNIQRNDIRFIYNNRFRLTLEGTDDVETLWSYFQKEDLLKLDNP